MDKAAHVLDRLADPTLQSSGVEEIKEMCRHFVKDIEVSGIQSWKRRSEMCFCFSMVVMPAGCVLIAVCHSFVSV